MNWRNNMWIMRRRLEDFENGDFAAAFAVFASLGDFEDAKNWKAKSGEPIYAEAVALMDSGEYVAAKEQFLELADYEDAKEMATKSQNYLDYADAMALYEAGDRYEAYQAFLRLGDFEDAEAMAEQCSAFPTTYAEKQIYTNPKFAYNEVTVRIYTNLKVDEAAYIKIYSQNTLVKAAFFAPGDNYSIGLPAGRYTFKIGYGNQWFGEEDMFGPKGSYSVMRFEDGTSTYLSYFYDYTIHLAVDEGGNVSNQSVSADDF